MATSGYDEKIDGPRLARASAAVLRALQDFPRRAWTLAELAHWAKCSEAGASARLRELRRVHGYDIQKQRRHASGGLWEYRIKPPPAVEPGEQGELYPHPK